MSNRFLFKMANSSASSQIRLLQDLIVLRREAAFKHGDYVATVRDNVVYSFVREFDGEKGLVKSSQNVSILFLGVDLLLIDRTFYLISKSLCPYACPK